MELDLAQKREMWSWVEFVSWCVGCFLVAAPRLQQPAIADQPNEEKLLRFVSMLAGKVGRVEVWYPRWMELYVAQTRNCGELRMLG